MGIRTSHIQHNFQMDIWSLQQSSRLSFTPGRITPKRPPTINLLSATHCVGPALNTRSRADSTPQTDAKALIVTETGNTTQKSL